MPARAVSKLPLLHEFEAWVEAQPCATVASRLPVVIDGPASPFQVLGSLVKKHASKEEGRFYTNLRELWTARRRQALPEEVASQKDWLRGFVGWLKVLRHVHRQN